MLLLLLLFSVHSLTADISNYLGTDYSDYYCY